MKNEFLNKISNQINISNSENEQLLSLLHNILDKKHIIIPNDESIKILLQNDDIKNLIKYTLNKNCEIKKEIEIKKKINFYYVNNKKIDEYIKLRSNQNVKKQKLLELKNKLKNIKEQRNNYISKNEEIIKEINNENKKDKLSRIKLKILNNTSSSLIMDIKNEFKKYSYLNGYKYSHLYPKKNIGIIIENENEEDDNEKEKYENYNKITNYNIENKNEIKEEEKERDINNQIDNKNEEQVSFITMSNAISNINDSKINQIINLPKLNEEEIIKYTKYSQNLFFEKIIIELKSIKNTLSLNEANIRTKDEELKINKLQKSKEVIAVENKAKQKIKNKDEEQRYKDFFTDIVTNFKNDIQKEEFNVSKNYTNIIIEQKNDITFNQTINELKDIQKGNKINLDVWQKIIDISKIRLIKDINDQYLNNKNNNLNLVKIKEIIIPKCIIEKNPQDTLNFYRNVINTYKKYKIRTNNFINKRLFPSLLKLEEKYSDFMTTLINEYDYYIKLNFENMKEDNDNFYSLKKFRYDLNLLKKNGIKSKNDLFGFYISNLYMKNIILQNEEIMNDFNTGKTFEFYLNVIKKYEDIRKNVAKYINNITFNEDLNLYYDKEELNLIYQYIKEFLNIDYIKHLNPFNP